MPLRRLLGRLRRVRLMTWWAIVFTFLTFYAIRDGREAHDALCVFRTDLVEDRDRAQSYLDEQPKADPVLLFGLAIPRATLTSNVLTQTSRIDSLSNLDCTTP